MIFGPFERMLAGRYLRARRSEGFVSVIAFFSLAGMTLGVGILIVVMSVMGGFRTEFVSKILGLTSKTEGVTVKVTGELNRPPYEKSNAGASLYEHAKTLAGEIGFELIDTHTGGGSDGNFTAPYTGTLDGLGVDGKGAHTHYEQLYVSSLEPRARLLYRLYQTLR